MTLKEYKQKVHEEFDEAWQADKMHSGFDASPDNIKAFYDQKLDNLLVEVEGCVAPEETGEFKGDQSKDEQKGWNECRQNTLDRITHFKGEGSKV